MESSLNRLDIYQRLAFLERICDGLEPARNLSFTDLYDRWKSSQFFKQLAELGFIQVSYNGEELIDFEPSEENGNRHQALALSCFVSSIYANSNAKVLSLHERCGIFTATFIRISSNSIEYVNDYGSNVRFIFDSSRPSQFI
jgi:hypothetical protein